MRNLRAAGARNWLWLLAAGLIIRLALAPLAYGFQYDMDTFGSWAQVLVSEPFRRFYDVAPVPDHLPGDMYLHAALGWLFRAFGGENYHGAAYRFLLKAVPSVADIAVALLIWAILRDRVTEEAGRLAAVFYALNPATIFLAAIWGQWDVVSGLFLLGGLAIVWRWPERWVWAVPIFAWMVMIKPPLALLALIGLLAVPLRDLLRGATLAQVVRLRIAEGIGALVVGLATITGLALPFDTAIGGMETRWSLLDRVRVAMELYPFTTLGAANIWMVPLGTPDRRSDTGGTLLGLTAQGWGTVLFLVALVYVGVLVARGVRRVDPVVLTVWAMATVNYAWFLLPTRAHERYLYPTVLLLVVLCGLARLDGRVTAVAGAVSLVYLLNLVGVYFRVPGVLDPVLFIGASLANIALFGIVATMPFWRDESDRTQADGTPLPVYAEDVVEELIEAGGATG